MSDLADEIKLFYIASNTFCFSPNSKRVNECSGNMKVLVCELLCSTGSSAWCSVVIWMGGKVIQEGGDVCIHIAHSLCCIAETNTTL